MFNIKVFKITDLIKYVVVIIVVIVSIFIITNIIKNSKKEDKKISLFNYDLTSCLEETSSIIKETNKSVDDEKKAYKKDFFEDILKSQIGSIEDFEENSEDIINEEVNVASTDVENTPSENSGQSNPVYVNSLAKTGLNTEVVTNNPISLNYNAEYGNVKIKNETSYELTDEMLNPNINIDNKNILLFHTHTCESYTSSNQFPYEPTGNYRTTDLNFTVARVGDELTNYLNTYGYNVIHDKTYHDYPAYNGSYTRSLETVQNVLKDNPSDIIFDVHRDAIGSRSDYAPCVKIGEDVCAQIMFVVGSDEGGLWHPNWNQNFKFAIKVQSKAEEMYPGLFKPITLTKYRYNQHTGKYASIIEVGATGNTLEQCLNSMKYFSKVLDEVLK